MYFAFLPRTRKVLGPLDCLPIFGFALEEFPMSPHPGLNEDFPMVSGGNHGSWQAPQLLLGQAGLTT